MCYIYEAFAMKATQLSFQQKEQVGLEENKIPEEWLSITKTHLPFT